MINKIIHGVTGKHYATDLNVFNKPICHEDCLKCEYYSCNVHSHFDGSKELISKCWIFNLYRKEILNGK